MHRIANHVSSRQLGGMIMPDALADLARFIAAGLPATDSRAKPLLEALFGGRYHQRFASQAGIRDPLTTTGGFIRSPA